MVRPNSKEGRNPGARFSVAFRHGPNGTSPLISLADPLPLPFYLCPSLYRPQPQDSATLVCTTVNIKVDLVAALPPHSCLGSGVRRHSKWKPSFYKASLTANFLFAMQGETTLLVQACCKPSFCNASLTARPLFSMQGEATLL
eukprot:scaffold137544_cov18-Tisochrysis_lutea.AAC.2